MAIKKLLLICMVPLSLQAMRSDVRQQPFSEETAAYEYAFISSISSCIKCTTPAEAKKVLLEFTQYLTQQPIIQDKVRSCSNIYQALKAHYRNKPSEHYSEVHLYVHKNVLKFTAIILFQAHKVKPFNTQEFEAIWNSCKEFMTDQFVYDLFPYAADEVAKFKTSRQNFGSFITLISSFLPFYKDQKTVFLQKAWQTHWNGGFTVDFINCVRHVVYHQAPSDVAEYMPVAKQIAEAGFADKNSQLSAEMADLVNVDFEESFRQAETGFTKPSNDDDKNIPIIGSKK